MTLRLRVLLGLGLVAAVLVGAGVVVTRSTRADLVAKVDEQLRTIARPRGGGLAGPDDGPGRGAEPGGLAPLRSTVWLGRISDGEVRTVVAPRTATGDTASPALSAADVAFLTTHPDQPRTVAGDGVARYRVLAGPEERGVTSVVGAPLDDVDASSRRLLAVELSATGAMLALLALVAFWVLRLGVRPVKEMAATAGAIAAGDLSRRVPEADPRTEVGELGAALNTMLSHIEEAFHQRAASEDRLRRFVADASHELRTPITTIRGYAELSRRGGLEDADARAAAMARTEQEAIRMGVLVDDLLLLARLDQGRPLSRDPVDVARIVGDAEADAAVAHPDHPVRAAVAATGPGTRWQVLGDDHRLRQVVANLVGNAVAHTPPGTTVALTLDADPVAPDRLRLVVADDGPGMAPELAGRAFERFARGDQARTRAAGSTGLGLSIVEAITAAHGGTVTLATAPGEGTVVTVSLPRDHAGVAVAGSPGQSGGGPAPSAGPQPPPPEDPP